VTTTSSRSSFAEAIARGASLAAITRAVFARSSSAAGGVSFATIAAAS
jgi:hypothetical protein